MHGDAFYTAIYWPRDCFRPVSARAALGFPRKPKRGLSRMTIHRFSDSPSPDLFDHPAELPSVAVDTSEIAATMAKGRAKADRRRVFAAIHDAGGLTCDECEVRLNLLHQTCAARCRDLEIQGLIEKSPVTRPTRTGSPARVYQLTIKGLSVWRRLESEEAA